ncbi:MAG: hypothetical protein H6719_29775 [Sandaracinaceae bacterium]|nr:hypothetical protein [Sandaracinaceae bacterium]
MVVNGNAKQVTDDLVDVLDQIVQAGDLFVSRSLPEGDEIASTIVRRGYPTVLTAGGDGTFVQMVTKITHEARAREVKPPRFGLLRLGTGNALAWVLGAQNPRHRGVVADLGRLRQQGGSRKLQLLDVEGVLTPFAGLGIDAIALDDYRATKERMQSNPLTRPFGAGGVAYLTAVLTRTMPAYLLRPHPNVRIVNLGAPVVRVGRDGEPVHSIQTGEVLFEGPTRMVAMSTIPYWGFGARIFPFADDRDDRFSLRVVDISSLQVAVNIRQIWDGTYRSDTIHDFLCDAIAIHYDEPHPMQIGGDPVGSRTDVEVRLAPEPIEVVDYYAPPPV